MIDHYDHLDEEGNPARIEVDLSLIDDSPDRDKPFLLWLFVKTTTDEQFSAFKDEVISTLEGALDAVYGGTITKEGWNELYFYAPTSKKFENLTSEVMSRHGGYPYQRGISRDAKWEMYQERLYPDGFNLLTIQNHHTLQALLYEGDDLTLVREVEHYFFFQTPTALARFEKAMEAHGFHLKEHITDDQSEYAYGLTLAKEENVTPETIHETTAFLYELVLHEHGHYEGWSTVLA